MAEIAVLQAEKREKAGKGPARAARRNGNVPAIIYGGEVPSVLISTGLKELHKNYLGGHFKSRLLDIQLGKESIRVLPRDIQLDPVSDKPLHVDFLRVTPETKVHVFIPVRFLNRDKSPGLKRGGVLNVVRREVELLCRADSIPTILEADLDGIKIGESIHSHSVTLPEGVTFAITDRDFTIATIVGRTTEEVIPTGAPEAVAVPVAGEEAEEEAAE